MTAQRGDLDGPPPAAEPPQDEQQVATAGAHRRRADRYVPPRYPVDEPPTWRGACSCGWVGPERYGTHLTGGVDLRGLDYADHESACSHAPAVPAAGAVDEAGLTEDVLNVVTEALPHSAGCHAHGADCVCAGARIVRAVNITSALLAGPLAPLLRELADTRAKLAAAETLADEWDSNINWREWGIGRRLRAALSAPATHTTSEDPYGCPDVAHHGVDCPGDRCRYAEDPS